MSSAEGLLSGLASQPRPSPTNTRAKRPPHAEKFWWLTSQARLARNTTIDGRTHDGLTALGTVDRLVRRHRHTTGVGDLVYDRVGDGGVGAFTAHGATEVIDNHGCAAAGKFGGIDAAESAARPGDDRHLAGEIDHAVLLLPIDRCTGRTLCWNRYLVKVRCRGERLEHRR